MAEFVSRYGYGDGSLPDPETTCPGDCEGTGWVPVYRPEADQRGFNRPGVARAATVSEEEEDGERYRAAWLAAEREHPATDGWHFVPCTTCHGTGTSH